MSFEDSVYNKNIGIFFIEGEFKNMEQNPLDKKSGQTPVEYPSHQDEVAIETKSSEAEARRSWETSFTDPSKHDDKKFCYIVTGLGDMGMENVVLEALIKHDKYDRAKEIRLADEPHRISEKEKISASIINQEHRETYGGWGLILDVPFDNVVAAYSEEAGTGFGGDFLNPHTPRERKKKYSNSRRDS